MNKMLDFLISREQAKQFAYDCFDVIVRDIKAEEEKEEVNAVDKNSQKCA